MLQGLSRVALSKSLSGASQFSSSAAVAAAANMRALLLGVYQEKDSDFVLTPAGKQFQDSTGGRLNELLQT